MTKKTPLNSTRREIIQKYATDHIRQQIDRTRESDLLSTMAEEANQAIRVKYPEADVAVLRKYGLTRKDNCLRFQFPSGRVDGFTFPADAVVDLPKMHGCWNQDVFPVSETFETTFDAHAKEKKANDELQGQRLTALFSFLQKCRTVEDVMEIVELPSDLLQRLDMKSSALIALSPEAIASLKDAFKKAA